MAVIYALLNLSQAKNSGWLILALNLFVTLNKRLNKKKITVHRIQQMTSREAFIEHSFYRHTIG